MDKPKTKKTPWSPGKEVPQANHRASNSIQDKVPQSLQNWFERRREIWNKQFQDIINPQS